MSRIGYWEILVFGVCLVCSAALGEHEVSSSVTPAVPATTTVPVCEFDLDEIHVDDVYRADVRAALAEIVMDPVKQNLGFSEQAADHLVAAAEDGAAEEVVEDLLAVWKKSDGVDHGQLLATVGEAAKYLPANSKLFHEVRKTLRGAITRLYKYDVKRDRNYYPLGDQPPSDQTMRTAVSAAAGMQELAGKLTPLDYKTLYENPFPEGATVLATLADRSPVLYEGTDDMDDRYVDKHFEQNIPHLFSHYASTLRRDKKLTAAAYWSSVTALARHLGPTHTHNIGHPISSEWGIDPGYVLTLDTEMFGFFKAVETESKDPKARERASAYFAKFIKLRTEAPAQVEAAARAQKARLDQEQAETEKEVEQTKLELAKELAKAGVDTAGLVDPTPICDGVGACFALADGDYLGAGLSVVSMLPYLGDAAAKPLKGARITQKMIQLGKKVEGGMARIVHIKATIERASRALEIAKEAARRWKDKDFSVSPQSAVAMVAMVSRKKMGKGNPPAKTPGLKCDASTAKRQKAREVSRTNNAKNPDFRRKWEEQQDRMANSRKKNARKVSESDGSGGTGWCSCPIRPNNGDAGMKEDEAESWTEFLIGKGCPKFVMGNGPNHAACMANARTKAPAQCREYLGHCRFFPGGK